MMYLDIPNNAFRYEMRLETYECQIEIITMYLRMSKIAQLKKAIPMNATFPNRRVSEKPKVEKPTPNRYLKVDRQFWRPVHE
jgi:arginine deiminase